VWRDGSVASGSNGVSTRATGVPLTAPLTDEPLVRAAALASSMAAVTSAAAVRPAAVDSVISFLTSATIGSTSSIRCFWMKVFGFRSRTSRSENSGPSSLLSCSCALPAIVRTYLITRAALRANSGSFSGPNRITAMTTRTRSSGAPTSNMRSR
jgi:hypothetical protein